MVFQTLDAATLALFHVTSNVAYGQQPPRPVPTQHARQREYTRNVRNRVFQIRSKTFTFINNKMTY